MLLLSQKIFFIDLRVSISHGLNSYFMHECTFAKCHNYFSLSFACSTWRDLIIIQTSQLIVLIVHVVIFLLHFLQTWEKINQFWIRKAAFLPVKERRRSLCGIMLKLFLYLVIFPFLFSKKFRCLMKFYPWALGEFFFPSRKFGFSGLKKKIWPIFLPWTRSLGCRPPGRFRLETVFFAFYLKVKILYLKVKKQKKPRP